MLKGGIIMTIFYIIFVALIDYVAMRLLLAHVFMETCAWVILISSLVGGIMIGISAVCAYDDWNISRTNKQDK